MKYHLPISRRSALWGMAVTLPWLLDSLVRGDDSTAPKKEEPSPRTFTYKKVGDCEIKADVYRLPGDEVRPAIIWIHGGALIFGHRRMLDADQRQLYLEAGYVVVSIDYRLAPESKLAAIVEDLQNAHEWVRGTGPELFRIDPDRIVVIGHSAGAYLALMSGFLKPRPKALVSFYGYGDITGSWYTQPSKNHLEEGKEPITEKQAYEGIGKVEISESPLGARRDFYRYCRQNGLWPKLVAGLGPDKEAEEFKRFCPVLNISKEYPPTLLLHGDKDTDVPFAQAQQMADALKRQQVPHRLIRMENHDHLFDIFAEGLPPKGKPVGLKQNKQVADAFAAVRAFLKEHAGA